MKVALIGGGIDSRWDEGGHHRNPDQHFSTDANERVGFRRKIMRGSDG